MLLLTFQTSLLALIAFSFVLIISVPVVFASSNGWNENKSFLLISAATWTALVILVGTLNYMVI